MFPLPPLDKLAIQILMKKIKCPNSFALPVTFSLLRLVYVLINLRFAT